MLITTQRTGERQKAGTTVRGSRAGKLCICRLVVEVRVILFSLLFTGRIERGFFSVLIWCMRVSNPNPSRGSPSDS